MNLRTAFVALLVLPAVLGPSRRARAEADTELLERIERDVGDSRKRLSLVRQYAEKGEIAPLERANQRFSEAETQFLLDNFEGCAAMLLDVIEVPEFKAGPKYPQALYYLAESFFQTESFIESLRYYRLAMAKLPMGKLYQDAVVRLLDLSDRVGDYDGVDQYVELVQKNANVRPEVTYLYAKWLAHRRDLKLEARVPRADAQFSLLGPGMPFHAQALFFRGALRVTEVEDLQRRLADLTRRERPGVSTPEMEALKQQIDAKLSEAADLQRQVLVGADSAKADPKQQRAKSLANLALARILYEQGKLEQAADRYNEVARDSEDYNDALFETAATFVKMGNYEQALRTSEILLIIGKDSAVLPEAKILQANLHLKLGQYEKASASFSEVANDYAPVYDQIRALLSRPNPIEYFDQVLQSSGKDMDILQLLPASARPFVKVDKQVSQARVISSELTVGRRGIEDSRALAKKLLDTLSTGKLQIFPQLQEGNSLAIEQSNRLGALEGELVKLQLRLLGPNVPAEVRDGLAKLDEERLRLDERFKNLPKTQEEYAERKAGFLKRIAELDKLAFSLANKVSELRANLVGLQIYWKNSRDQRVSDPQRESERQAEFVQYTTLVEQLEEERIKVARQIDLERVQVAGSASGGDLEEDLRARYRALLADTQRLITAAAPSVPPANLPLLERVQQARTQVDALQTDLAGLRARIRERAVAKADEYRREVLAQQTILDGYQREVDSVGGNTRQLLGQIAYDSFSRVGRQFYDLVLKADVGIIDVAWTRKKDRSDKISGLGRDRETEITSLRERFKEVLNDAD